MVAQKNDPILKTFGPVWDAAGIRGMDGTGYAHTPILRGFGYNPAGSTFVTKTFTLRFKRGNTPFRTDTLRPVEMLPRSVVWKPLHKSMLNAWGLSNPGIEDILDRGILQERTDNFMISFMPLKSDMDEYVKEVEAFVRILISHLKGFKCKIAIQFNVSCPNAGVDLAKLAGKLYMTLDILQELGIPAVFKESVDLPWEPFMAIHDHPAFSGLCTTNSVPFGKFPNDIPWEKIFGGQTSPLKARFGVDGGLSGPYLRPLVKARIKHYRAQGFTKHINGGGGIFSAADAKEVYDAGADSLFWGTVANHAPWEVQRIIQYAHTHMAKTA